MQTRRHRDSSITIYSGAACATVDLPIEETCTRAPVSAEGGGRSSRINLMTLIPLRQPIRALGVAGRPALSACYPTNICRGLLPSPINVARKEGRD